MITSRRERQLLQTRKRNSRVSRVIIIIIIHPRKVVVGIVIIIIIQETTAQGKTKDQLEEEAEVELVELVEEVVVVAVRMDLLAV